MPTYGERTVPLVIVLDLEISDRYTGLSSATSSVFGFISVGLTFMIIISFPKNSSGLLIKSVFLKILYFLLNHYSRSKFKILLTPHPTPISFMSTPSKRRPTRTTTTTTSTIK